MERSKKILWLRFLQVGVLSLAMISLLAGPAAAVLKDLDMTPRVAEYGFFAKWYRDKSTNILPYTQGLPLELCLSRTESPLGGPGTYMCNLLPEPATQEPGGPAVGSIFNPANPIVFPSHFPDEAFWWSGDAVIDENGYEGTLVLGLEAAFGGGPVAENDQVSFARVRVRIDTPAAGNYRITHPYSPPITFFNVPAGKDAINYTSDIGLGSPGDFTGALTGAIGPFLVWDTDFPVVVGDEVFVGDPNIEHTVTGSPFGTNFFRIERLDADGNVLETVETDLFSITGKIYTRPIPAPLRVNRATYVRSIDGKAQIDVFATSGEISNANTPSTLTVTVANRPPVPMQTIDNANHAAHIEVNPVSFPASVLVKNTADVPATQRRAPVTDVVTIFEATYNPQSDELKIVAKSSDAYDLPLLTATGFGVLTSAGPDSPGVLVKTGVAEVPWGVEVVSAKGGKATAPVLLTPAGFDASLVLAPNGGETLISGTTFATRWPAVADAVGYRLQYSTDNGTTWKLIANLGNITSYDWTVPAVLAPTPAFFRVVALRAGGGNLGISRSDAVFTIASGIQ